MTPTLLQQMSAAAFGELVRDSIPGSADPALWDALTDPAVISRTRKVLGSVNTDLQEQLALANARLAERRAACLAMGPHGRHEYDRAVAEQAQWRQRAARFKRSVHLRLRMVAERTGPGPAQPQGTDPGLTKRARKYNRAALEQLARAVAVHERTITGGDGAESDDDALWDSLHQITVIARTGEEMCLAQWLSYLDDLREEDSDEQAE